MQLCLDLRIPGADAATWWKDAAIYLNILKSAQEVGYCALHMVHCILCAVYCVLYIVYCILYAVYCVLDVIMHCTSHSKALAVFRHYKIVACTLQATKQLCMTARYHGRRYTVLYAAEFVLHALMGVPDSLSPRQLVIWFDSITRNFDGRPLPTLLVSNSRKPKLTSSTSHCWAKAVAKNDTVSTWSTSLSRLQV